MFTRSIYFCLYILSMLIFLNSLFVKGLFSLSRLNLFRANLFVFSEFLNVDLKLSLPCRGHFQCHLPGRIEFCSCLYFFQNAYLQICSRFGYGIDLQVYAVYNILDFTRGPNVVAAIKLLYLSIYRSRFPLSRVDTLQ